MNRIFFSRRERIVIADREIVHSQYGKVLSVNRVDYRISDSDNVYRQENAGCEKDISNICIGLFFRDCILCDTVIAILEYYGFNNIHVSKTEQDILGCEIMITDLSDLEIIPSDSIIIDTDENSFFITKLYEKTGHIFPELSYKYYSLLFHKFKNPLSTMYGYIQLLSSKIKGDEKALAYFSRISEQFDIMNSLVGKTSDIIMNNEKKEGKILLHDFFINFFQNSDKYAEVSISADIPDNIAILFNSESFAHAIDRIFENYIEQNPDREDYFFDILYKASENISLIQIKASDMMISENFRKKIFEPFFSSGKGKNFGLGLNEARKIFSINGCFLEFENGENFSVFKIFLPKKILT